MQGPITQSRFTSCCRIHGSLHKQQRSFVEDSKFGQKMKWLSSYLDRDLPYLLSILVVKESRRVWRKEREWRSGGGGNWRCRSSSMSNPSALDSQYIR